MTRKPTQGAPRVVILKTGTTYPPIREQFGDFDTWFIRGLPDTLDLSVVDVTTQPLPGHPGDWQGVIITGSPAMVSERPDWSENTAAWVRQAVESKVPVLGVCYGHQLLAHALGGEVGYHPEGRETGTHEVTLSDNASSDPLFSQLPRRFDAQLTHKQSVLRLPPEAILLGRSEFEPHQAFRVGPNAWGVQFHPEFTAPIMSAYLDVQQPELAQEGFDVSALKARVQSAPEASSVLTLFSGQVHSHWLG